MNESIKLLKIHNIMIDEIKKIRIIRNQIQNKIIQLQQKLKQKITNKFETIIKYQQLKLKTNEKYNFEFDKKFEFEFVFSSKFEFRTKSKKI